MRKRYVIGIDQSTQGTKAILMDPAGEIAARSFLPHHQIVSPEGWVSHDGEEICANAAAVVRQLMESAAADRKDVAAIGISNQRETTIAWDRKTGRPVGHAVVWQCARAKKLAESLGEEFASFVRERTGIPLSPYFPAAKAAWIMQNNAQARALAGEKRLCIGTIDAWLVFRLTEGRVFRTDFSNASRTQLFDLHLLRWNEELCRGFGIPLHALPEAADSDGDFGTTTLGGYFDRPVPIRGVLGDSHAALFGQGCLLPGMAKATYGTGSSVMMNIGQGFRESRSGLVTSLAWGRSGRVDYVLEGNVNYAGAVITWLQKDLGLIGSAKDTEALAREANPEDTTYLVPAFSGLGAPYWKNDARAVFCGMSRTTGRREMVKAGLESIAYQVTDIVEAMSADAGVRLSELRADGGPTGNGYLMQFQSDMSRAVIRVPGTEELSAMGAALLAGIGAGLCDESIVRGGRVRTSYEPAMDMDRRNEKYGGWKQAVRKAFQEEAE